MAQANILGFLDVEHALFHAKDLESFALDLLSGGQLDFWVSRAALNLLKTVGSSNKLNQAKQQIRHYAALPSWLVSSESQPPVLPWMPTTLSKLHTSAAMLTSQGKASLCLDKSKHFEEDAPTLDASMNNGSCRANEKLRQETEKGPTLEALIHEGSCHANEKIRQEMEGAVTGLQVPPHYSEGCNRTSEGRLLSTGAQNEEESWVLSSKSPERVQKDSTHSEEEDGSVSALAHSLREVWIDRQPTLDDLCTISSLPDARLFFKSLKPWEMKDDTLLSMMKLLSGKDSGFAWSAQTVSFCLLPKLLLLEQPASRFVVSAVIEACKAHPRAAIDALLIPLVLIEKGPTKAQCDVMNRVLTECFSDNHLFSLCGKIFLSNRRQCLPFPDPPFVRKRFLSASIAWSEPAWALVQNLISRPMELDMELLETIVDVCGEEVVKFAESLRFCNLLLCLLSKHGTCLGPFKSKLQRISEQTKTFITKTLTAKASFL